MLLFSFSFVATEAQSTWHCYCRIEIDTKLPVVGDQKWVVWICSFNVPMAPGKTRSIVCSARNFFQFSVPGPAWWQVRFLCPVLSFFFCLIKAHACSSLLISMVFHWIIYTNNLFFPDDYGVANFVVSINVKSWKNL